MNSWHSLRPSRSRVAAQTSMHEISWKWQWQRSSSSRYTSRPVTGTPMNTCANLFMKWEGPRSFSWLTPKDQPGTIQASLAHGHLLHQVVAHLWTLVLQAYAHSKGEEDPNAIIARTMGTLHMSAQNLATPGSNKLRLYSPRMMMMNASKLCKECPSLRWGTISRI